MTRTIKASQMIELQRKHSYYMRLEACNGPDYAPRECGEALTDYIDYYTRVFGECKPILASTTSYLTARHWHQVREMGDTVIDLDRSIEHDAIFIAYAPDEPTMLDEPTMPERPPEMIQKEDQPPPPIGSYRAHCPTCDGTGRRKGQECVTCHGTGAVIKDS